MYVIDVDAFTANDGGAYRDVIPVRVYTTPTALINGQYRDVTPVDAVNVWNYLGPDGKFHSPIPIKVVDTDTVLINGVRRNAMPVRVTSGTIGFMLGAQAAFDFVANKYRVGTFRQNTALNSVWAGGTTPTNWPVLFGPVIPQTSVYNPGSAALEFDVSNSRCVLAQNATFAANTQYVFSCTVEANLNGYSISDMVGFGGAFPTGGVITWPQGALSVPTAGQRIYAVATIGATAGIAQLRIGLAVQGTIPSTGAVVLSAPQLETVITGNSVPPTAYIPTTAAAVTIYDVDQPGDYGTTFSTAAIPTLSIARASVGYVEDQADDGSITLRQCAPNTPRIGRLKGLLVEEGRTNKCTNNNVNPQSLTNVAKSGDAAATLTLVDDSAALAAIGLTGNVFKLDNSLGVANAMADIAGASGNTNPHAVSTYMRGTGNGTVTSNNTSFGGSVPLTAKFVRYGGTATPSSTTTALRVVATAGSVVYFVLNQFEEGSFITSPVPVAGAIATRAADNVALVGISASAPLTFMARFSIPSLDGIDVRGASFSAAGSTTDRVLLLRNNSNLALVSAASGGVGTYNQGIGGKTGARTVQLAVSHDGTTYRAAADGGGMANAVAAAPQNINRLDCGATNGGGSNYVNGYLARVLFYPVAMNDAQLQVMTA